MTLAPRYREAQQKRRELLARGVPSWRVTACQSSDLNQLDAEYTQLTLAPDVEKPTLTVIDGELDDEWPDDVFSTRYFKARMAGLPVPDFDHHFDGLGGNCA